MNFLDQGESISRDTMLSNPDYLIYHLRVRGFTLAEIGRRVGLKRSVVSNVVRHRQKVDLAIQEILKLPIDFTELP